MKKTSLFLSSPLMIASLALPAALWLAVAVYGMKLPPYEAAGATAFMTYYTALMAVLALRAPMDFRRRSHGPALVTLGVFLILLHGVYLYGFRFAGKTGFGEGENFTGYYEV